MSEHDARHRRVVGLAALAEDVRRGATAVVLALVPQRPDAGHVSYGPYADTGAHAAVDRYPARSGPNSDVLQAEPVDPRPPAGRDEQSLGLQLRAGLEGADV